MIDTIKKLTIVNMIQFIRTIFFKKIGLSRLMSKLSRTNLLFPFVKMVNSSKDGTLLKFKRWFRIGLSFDGLVFLSAKVDIPICSEDLTFKCLFISPQHAEWHLTHIYLYATPDPKSKGKSINNKGCPFF